MEKQILENPRFKSLVKKRNRFTATLIAIMLFVYTIYALMLAYFPTVLALPLWHGSLINIGIPFAIFVIVLTFGLTGIYIRKANNEFDIEIQKVLEEITE